MILFNANQNSYHVMPTTKQADSNTDLDERTTVSLFLKVLPAGTLSLKSPCQLPVDVLSESKQVAN